LIRLERASVSIGQHRILEGVDLEVARGVVTGIVGPNGAGKSTLLAIASGARAPTSGVVSLDDRPLASYALRELAQRRAMLLQDGDVAFEFTALDVARMGLAPFARAPWHDELVEAALADLGLGALVDRRLGELSGGERQRVQLARVLVQAGCCRAPSPLLILDEPVSHQDPSWQLAILELLGAAAGRGFTVLLTLHDLGHAARACEELVLLSGGVVARRGPTREVLVAPELESAFGVRARLGVDDRGAPLLSIARSPAAPPGFLLAAPERAG
jgi:iron complex transport system ATP-binding protein